MFVYTCECGHKNKLKDPCVCEKCGKKTPINEKTKLFIKLFDKLSETSGKITEDEEIKEDLIGSYIRISEELEHFLLKKGLLDEASLLSKTRATLINRILVEILYDLPSNHKQ